MGFDLQDSTFRQICEFIYERSGIFIPPTKKYLVENRLSRLVEEFNLKGFEEFLYILKYSPEGNEIVRLFNAITTNETYFFREPQQFEVFIEHIVPLMLEDKKAYKEIKVWSAACSTGEEPYTISMVMRERRPNVRLGIVGSDISTGVIESARKAVYSSYSVRNVPDHYLRKYFVKSDQDHALDVSIRNSARFVKINLMEKRDMLDMKGLDVIFCRNVLIYFDDRAKQKAVSFLYDSLRQGGYLIIGASESLHNVTRAFRPTTINRVVVYQKV